MPNTRDEGAYQQAVGAFKNPTLDLLHGRYATVAVTDAHFTARVIGAPNDKYSAIEPHVQVEYDILKDTSCRSWAKPKMGL
ncbi:MAG TPA: hypothetical protein H9870_04225 [Candidatus Corynebacterium avicola]|uniref:Uncharacterized protein n=1 Tax=Candidatus Corynebacterium avicola TaxID=2838527 RepID=A0A9D1ULE6_9CORY|nr:hypothetical protein [Candidatus Corynebacterium avicola]